jgi:hypothetical protein
MYIKRPCDGVASDNYLIDNFIVGTMYDTELALSSKK